MPTKPYWTRLNEPAPISVITAIAATSAESAAGTPKSDSAAAMPANSDTVEPRLAMIIVIAANAAQRRPKRSRIKPGQALASGEAHARADLLGDQQRHLGHEDDPQQVVAEARAGDRVGRDAASVVVGKATDDARPEHGHRGQEACAPAQPAPAAAR